MKSTVHGTLKLYGKYSISLLMPKQANLLDGTRPVSHVTPYRKRRHIFFALSFYRH